MAAQFAEEREQIVMDFLEKQGSIHIGDVTDMLRISPSTARLLLQKMQDKGMLKRTHGGAVPIKKEAPPSGASAENSSYLYDGLYDGRNVYGGQSGRNVNNSSIVDANGNAPGNGLSGSLAVSGSGSVPGSAQKEQAGNDLSAEGSLPCAGIHRRFANISNLEKKQLIAAAAAATVRDEDFISIGSGTTTWLMAKLLHDKRDLTVVTDSIPVACELLQNENITLYVCGGWIMPRNGACRGITAENFFHDMKVDKAYNSADSLNIEVGATSSDYDPRTERAICHSGKECYILADSTKFSKRAYMDKVLSIQEIDHVISDAGLSPQYADALRRAGVDVVIAAEP